MARTPKAPAPMTSVETNTRRRSVGRRQAFEAANPERMKTVQTLGSESKSDAYARLGYHQMEPAGPHSQVG